MPAIHLFTSTVPRHLLFLLCFPLSEPLAKSWTLFLFLYTTGIMPPLMSFSDLNPAPLLSCQCGFFSIQMQFCGRILATWTLAFDDSFGLFLTTLWCMLMRTNEGNWGIGPNTFQHVRHTLVLNIKQILHVRHFTVLYFKIILKA